MCLCRGCSFERGEHGTERMTVTDSDAAFILGKGGKTKEKIARVSKCKLDLSERNRESVLEINGTENNRRRARKYIKCVMAQRVGPVRDEDVYITPHAGQFTFGS